MAPWLPLQHSYHTAPNPGDPAAVSFISLGLSLPIHPCNEQKVPEVNTHLSSTSDLASSVQGDPVQGWWGWELDPSVEPIVSKAPRPKLISLELKTCSLVTEGWSLVSENTAGVGGGGRGMRGHQADLQEKGFFMQHLLGSGLSTLECCPSACAQSSALLFCRSSLSLFYGPLLSLSLHPSLSLPLLSPCLDPSLGLCLQFPLCLFLWLLWISTCFSRSL